MDRAYGQFKSDGGMENGKASGKAFILKQPVTDQLWIDHIEGKDPSLGIIPIRDDSTCIWGCIDVDTYPLDYGVIVSKIRNLKLPLVMCRSKSGGAHIFLFTKEPVPAKLMREKLIEWSGELGYANCEVFPKQIEIKADRGDTGNFLNLPYHGGDDSMRHGFTDDGGGATLDEFFSLYDTYCTTEKDLRKFKIERNKDLAYLDDGPPCLATLMGQGIPEGGRDNTLYQYAVYAKKKWPDDWQNKIDEFNHKYMERPLGSQQVQKTIRQHEKKDYQYKCKDQPMCGVCSSIQCRTRPYGIGDDIDYKVSDLTKFQSDKSIWFLNIDGERMRVSTEELYNQHKFRLACMDQVHALPNLMPQQMWTRKIHNIDEIRIGKALFEEREYIEKTDSGKADKVKKMTAYFKMDSLEKFLEKNRFKDFSTQEMTAHIRDKLGGGDTRRKVLNKTTYMWYVPWQKKVDTELDRPNMDEETPF